MKGTAAKMQCTFGLGIPCCVHGAAEKPECTCGTGTPCCIHEVAKGKSGKGKVSGGSCEPGCNPSSCQ